MAQTQVRKQVAGITTALALAVLMAGPASTFGLGVPAVGGSDSATGTVQGAVETTQQTAATTVTNVESTVQTTAAAPQAVTNQVQSSVGGATAAPTAVVPAPAHNAPAAAPPPRKATTRTAAPNAAPKAAQRSATAIARAARPAALPATRVERVIDRAKAVTRTGRVRSGSAADAPAPPVELAAGCAQLLQTLPAALDVNALITVVCNAGELLGPPARITTTVRSGDPLAALGGVVATISKRLRVVTDRLVMPLRDRNGRFSETSLPSGAAGGHPGSLVPVGRAGGPGGPISPAFASRPGPSAAQSSVARATASSGHYHHGFFSGKPTGTEILTAILIVNLAILGGIAMWRAAARWVIPRWA